jgi:hypothetical protein
LFRLLKHITRKRYDKITATICRGCGNCWNPIKTR